MVILFIGLLVLIVFLQAYSLVRLRGAMRVAAACCAILMMTLGGVSLALMQGSNLAPLIVVVSLPVAVVYLVALLVLDARFGRRGPRS